MKLRYLALSLAMLATTAAAYATPLGTDPEPGIVHVILHALGLV